MATYKVLQDIEAEDKFIWMLSFRQFVFALIGVVCLYLSVWSIFKGAWPVCLVLMPVALAVGFLAFPWSREQTTEIWLAARIRFLIKPRKRIWDQTGIKELVTITVPKNMHEIFMSNLSQNEVKSRLQALANTIDSRGWAVKNVNVNMFAEPSYVDEDESSDRLVAPAELPQDVPVADVQAADDMMDAQANEVAQHLDQMMKMTEQSRREAILTSVSNHQDGSQSGQGGPPADYWFMNQPTQAQTPAAPQGFTTFDTSMVQPGADDPGVPDPTADEQTLISHAAQDEQRRTAAWSGNLKTISPIGATPTAAPATAPYSPFPTEEKTEKTATTPPAILELANNDDLNVATIARQANRLTSQQEGDEVVIPLR